VNPPRKHHYVPVFYLKQWAGGDGRLCQYRRVYDGKVAVNRKHPDATGYKVDLYKIDELSPEDAQCNRIAIHAIAGPRWSRLSEQIFRVDKWSVCQG
jgi:hypothetical protein